MYKQKIAWSKETSRLRILAESVSVCVCAIAVVSLAVR